MTDWKPGARVRHATFGLGIVLESTGDHVAVHFHDVGRKKLVASLANLAKDDTPEPVAQSRKPFAAPVLVNRNSAPAAGAGAQATSGPRQESAAVPTSIDHLIDLARRKVGSEESLNAFVSSMRAALPSRRHPHVGTLSGMRVQQFQNWLLDENPKWQLTDAQLLAVMRVEYPMATGVVHSGDADTGLRQVAGIRAAYNRDGHNGPSPTERGMPYSVSYGRY